MKNRTVKKMTQMQNTLNTRTWFLTTKLEIVQVEKDLGVIVDHGLSGSCQCVVAVKQGHIARCIEYKSKDVILILNNTLVRPHLKYCALCSSGDRTLRKIVRRWKRGKRSIPSIRDRSYEDRLKMLNLFKLCKRRLRGNLIEAFKFIKGINKVNYMRLFRVSLVNRTRGHQCVE